MNTNEILAHLDAEIARLQEVKRILSGTTTPAGKRESNKSKPAATSAVPKKRNLSPEARARIAAAQKTRWAKFKKAAKAA